QTMKPEEKKLLERWLAAEKGDGIRQATARVRGLWIIGLVLFTVAVIGAAMKMHSALVIIAAGISGCTIADTNALVSRLELWPFLRKYLDWKRVEKDAR